MFLQQLINGLSLGSIYALIALGYTMVYGIVKLINFAHGDVMMMGAYAGYFVLILMGVTVPGMICAFLVPLLGLIFSIVGLSKSKKINDGKELSIVGIILSSLFLLIRIITIGLFLALAVFTVANEDKISGAIEDAGSKIPGIIERFDNYENFEDNEFFD